MKTSGVVISASFVLLCSGLLFTQGLTNTLLLMGISFAMMLIGGLQMKKFLLVLVAYGVVGGAAILVKKSNEQHYSEAELLHITENGEKLRRRGGYA